MIKAPLSSVKEGEMRRWRNAGGGWRVKATTTVDARAGDSLQARPLACAAPSLIVHPSVLNLHFGTRLAQSPCGNSSPDYALAVQGNTFNSGTSSRWKAVCDLGLDGRLECFIMRPFFCRNSTGFPGHHCAITFAGERIYLAPARTVSLLKPPSTRTSLTVHHLREDPCVSTFACPR